jgi:Putative Flp pilus-assembly TadE/G-like
MTRVRQERGQALVMSVISLVVVLGMAALVLDVGAWFHQKRQLQATADASALAGAQKLPVDPGGASAQALAYANKNGGGVAAADIAVTSGPWTNDTISVKAQKDGVGFFSRIAGVLSVNIGAKAAARVYVPAQAKGVAPIVVKNTHPLLKGAGCPCFNSPTTLPLAKDGSPGSFDLINLDNSHGGTGQSILADWIIHGYNDYLPLGQYYTDTGAKFNASEVQAALTQRIGTVLMFPVYDIIAGSGAGAQYHVIGWAGFYLTGFTVHGSSGTISGYFTEYIAQGLMPTGGGGNPPWFGVVSVQLIK